MNRAQMPSCLPNLAQPPEATSSAQHFANRYLVHWQTAVGGHRILGLVAVVALVSLPLSERWEPVPWALAFVFIGFGCALQFWRCRTAHCGITALLAPLGLVMLAGAILGTGWLSGTGGLIALGLLAVGFGFEAIWVFTHEGRSEFARAGSRPKTSRWR